MYFPVIVSFLLVIANAEETCTPPQELTDNEAKCLDSSTTFFERVQHRATGLFTSAKKKLGIDSDAQSDPLNCDYYLCVLRSIKMVNDYGILELEGTKGWLNKNVPKEFKEEMSSHAVACYDKIGKNNSNNESNCDRAPDYVKCLHDFEKCQIIKFP